MFNQLVGIYLYNKYNLIADRIQWAETVPASSTVDKTLSDAINGAALKGDLATLNYFLTKYTMWTQNGIIQVEMKPDGESTQKVKTNAFTQKVESPFVPAKYVETELNITLTNDQEISDDVFITVDIFKLPQTKVPELIDLAKSIILAPDDIDIQTLGIEKYLIYTNELLKALIIANKGTVPPPTGELPTYIKASPLPTGRCKRS